MLTRLEVDGFKNLVGVSVDLGPFTCVAGPNGIGKSNLFDGIRLLSLLAEHKLLDAARRVRGADDDPTDPRDLFTRIPGHTEPSRPMRFGAEVILPPAIQTHQDGGSRGNPRTAPAAAATATVVGATNSVDDPTIFALKQEMLSWRHLALEPSAMRRPDKYWQVSEGASIAENGARIPATLWSLAESDDEREELMGRIALDLSDLVPVTDVRVTPNDANQQFELEVLEPSGQWLGARSLSEGTLRFLALITVAGDPGSARLVCMEEPENGIHPERLPAMLALLDAIAVDPRHAPGPDNAVRQVLVNTHSPRLVQILEGGGRQADLLVAESARVSVGGVAVRTLRFRHRAGTWRERVAGPGVGPGLAIAYLTVPPGAQAPLLVADGA